MLLPQPALAQMVTATGGVFTTNGAPPANGPSWNIGADELAVGAGPGGTLTIEDGGQVTNGNGYIAYNAGNTGTVVVRGSNGGTPSTWTNNGTLILGFTGFGQGLLTIEDGGVVRATTVTLTSNSSGDARLELLGDAVNGRGVLETLFVSAGNGITTDLVLNGGILRATGDHGAFLNNFPTLAVGANGAFFDSNGHNIVVGTTFTGNSTFNKLGAGRLVLTGNSAAFAGSVVIDQGTLRLDGASGFIAGNVTNDGVFEFNRTNAMAITGVISGGGSVNQMGSGTTTLGAVNSYTGGTSFTGGKLSVAADTALGDAVGALTFDGGMLQVTGAAFTSTARTINWGAGGGGFDIVDAGNDFVVAQSLAGAGGLTKDGAGSLRLTGNNAYGDTTIAGGSLIVGDGANAGTLGTGNVANNGSLFFDRADAFTVANAISGAGSVEFQGGGTAELTAASSYTGATTLTAGTLRVNGSIASSSGLTVAPGATIGGSGFLPSATINGTLAPGNSIGTVTVVGNLVLGAGSTYAVEVSTAAADRTNVTGTANLTGATVVTTYEPGTYVDKEYVILRANGGLGGTTFAGLAGVTPFNMSQSLRYDANNAYLVIDTIYSQLVGFNFNQQAVATAINSYFAANGGIPGAFVGLTPQQLTGMSGEISTAAVGAGLHAAGMFLDQLSDPAITAGGSSTNAGDASAAYAPLAYSVAPASLSSPAALAALGADAPTAAEAANAALAMSSAHSADPIGQVLDARWKLWGAAYGGVAQIDGDATVGSADVTTRNWGIASGFDRSFGNGHLGLALGGARSTFDLSAGLGSGRVGIFNAGLYGSHNFGNAYVSGAFAYGWNDVRTTRLVAGDTLTANFNAHTLSGRVEAGYRWGGISAITPYAALQGGSYFLPAYAEASALGGPFALAYGSQTESMLRTELGARFEHSIPISNGSLKFSGRAAWAWNVVNGRAVTTAFQALPGQTFTVNGARPDRHAALIDVGIEAAFASGLSAKLSFSGEFSGNVAAYGASAKLSYRW